MWGNNHLRRSSCHLGWLPNTLAFKISREDRGVMENFEGELEGNNKNQNFKEEKSCQGW
jgi:hypothetical protein